MLNSELLDEIVLGIDVDCAKIDLATEFYRCITHGGRGLLAMRAHRRVEEDDPGVVRAKHCFVERGVVKIGHRWVEGKVGHLIRSEFVLFFPFTGLYVTSRCQASTQSEDCREV